MLLRWSCYWVHASQLDSSAVWKKEFSFLLFVKPCQSSLGKVLWPYKNVLTIKKRNQPKVIQVVLSVIFNFSMNLRFQHGTEPRLCTEQDAGTRRYITEIQQEYIPQYINTTINTTETSFLHGFVFASPAWQDCYWNRGHLLFLSIP